MVRRAWLGHGSIKNNNDLLPNLKNRVGIQVITCHDLADGHAIIGRYDRQVFTGANNVYDLGLAVVRLRQNGHTAYYADPENRPELSQATLHSLDRQQIARHYITGIESRQGKPLRS